MAGIDENCRVAWLDRGDEGGDLGVHLAIGQVAEERERT